MSFGALSLEAKMALAKGASMAGTATCSGEGGMIPPERDLSTKWYYQVIQSRYGFNPHHLMLADGIEFFIGQGCKVGLGGHLMGQKVTEQVAEMRSLPAGIDQRSPARHPDWLGPDDLSLKVQETREATNYEVPIQLKLGAARVYDDVRMAAKCGPDIIYLDGAEGGTGAGPHVAAEETGIPLMAAIPEARRALEDVGLADEVDLVVAGGIRNGGDIAKCLALGADAIAIGHSALMALNCNKEIPGVTDYEGTVGVPAGQCYHCHTGRCPVGITTQDAGAAQAPPRRGGRPARVQLPPHADARGADARPGLRQDQRPQPRARGPRGAHGRGLGDGAGAAGGHRVHPRGQRGAGAGRDPHPARPVPREPGRLPAGAHAHGRGGCGMTAPDDIREPEKVVSIDAEYLSGKRFPYQEDISLVEDIDLEAATPGADLNWLEDVELLEEEGTPAVFDRYSNSFLRIYFPIPEGREDEIARKVLIAHLTAGNSYGIRLKQAHAKFAQPELGPWVEGSTIVGGNWKRAGARGLGAAASTEMTSVPASARHLVIGAGVHGLSTAWHLAQAGEQALVVDKSAVAAGASGIACGVVRNNYFQPAMQELMAACVEVWESDPEALNYHGSGYIALGPPSQESDLTEVYERQQSIGYRSELHLGEDAVRAHMRGLYGDWRAQGLSICLHERSGGFAFNRESMLGLAAKARAAGATIAEGVEVSGFEFDGSGAVTRVETSAGPVEVEQVVVAVGPWIPRLWRMLGLSDRIDIRRPDGEIDRDRAMWTYWYLQEGEVELAPATLATAAGREGPVLHVDSDLPLADDDGRRVSEGPWGIYVKPDRKSVQGGAQPLPVGTDIELDPYPTGTVEPGFADLWCAALSHCMERFEGCRSAYRQVRSGGPGAFTADNFPVFDYLRPNVYVAADSNHGYKMIAVGREVARVLGGEHSSLLHPFRFDRFASGDLHPVSHSPYPWS